MSACNVQATMIANGHGTERSLERSLPLFIRACDANNGTACANLGKLNRLEVAPGSSFLSAVRLYEKSCSLGSQLGCRMLSTIVAWA